MERISKETAAELEPGSVCPHSGCTGVMNYAPVEGCSCHINPPCSACENQGLVCDDCGFDTAEEWKENRRTDAEYDAKEEREIAKIEARLKAEKKGNRRGEVTRTHTANPFNSTPFTDCCRIAAINTDRCPNCEAQIIGHDDGLAERRREVGAGNCLMCGKRRGDPAISGNCHC